jgi:hypothetical protein
MINANLLCIQLLILGILNIVFSQRQLMFEDPHVLSKPDQTYPCTLNDYVIDLPGCNNTNCITQTPFVYITDNSSQYHFNYDSSNWKWTTTENPNDTMVFQCTLTSLSGIPNIPCEKACVFHDNRLGLTCSGTTTYCAQNLTTCVSYLISDCSCNAVWGKYQQYILINNVWSLVTATTLASICIAPVFSTLATPSKRTFSIPLTSPTFSVDLQDKLLTVTCDNKTQTATINLSKGTWFYSANLAFSPWFFVLPNNVFDISGHLEVEIITQRGVEYDNLFQIIGRMDCIFVDCFLCKEAFDNFSCLPMSYQAGLVIFCIVFGCLVIALCPAVAYLTYFSCSFFWCACSCCWRTTSKMHKTKAFKNAQQWAKGKTDNITELITVKDSEGKSLLDNKTMLILIIMFLPLVLGTDTICDNGGLTIAGTQQTCTTSDNLHYQTCSIHYNFQGTISKPGLSSCFTLVDGMGNVTFTGELTYVNLTNTILLNRAYYTSEWEGYSESTHRCYGAGPCGTRSCERCCTDKSADGQLVSTQVLNYPGVSTCHTSCGCATCDGCFYCDSSCLYSGYGIVPICSRVFQVQTLGQSLLTPTLRLTLTPFQGGPPEITYVTLTGVPVTTASGAHINLIGTLVGDSSAFGSQSVVNWVGTNVSWVYTVSPINQPQRGTIGDIQADTLADLQMPTINSFRYSQDIVQHLTDDFVDVYNFADSGLKTVQSLMDPFPMVLAGNSWSYQGNSLQGLITNGGALIYKFDTPQKIQYTVNTLTTCPKQLTPTLRNNLTVAGCFNCDEGFQINITLMSKCAPGPITLKAGDTTITLFTKALILNTYATDCMIYGSTTQPQNDFTLFFIGTGSTMRLQIQFTATRKTVISNDTSNRGQDFSGPGPADGNDINNTFNDDGFDIRDWIPDWFLSFFGFDLANWVNWFIFVFEIVLIIIIIILFGPVFYKLIKFSVSLVFKIFDHKKTNNTKDYEMIKLEAYQRGQSEDRGFEVLNSTKTNVVQRPRDRSTNIKNAIRESLRS